MRRETEERQAGKTRQRWTKTETEMETEAETEKQTEKETETEWGQRG